jgi:hypothetical protein
LYEAFHAEDAAEWKTAAQKEYNSLISNGTWKLVDPPEDRKVVGCKWIFKKKDETGWDSG